MKYILVALSTFVFSTFVISASSVSYHTTGEIEAEAFQKIVLKTFLRQDWESMELLAEECREQKT